MAGKPSYRNASPIADLAAGVLDPLLQKRAGISVALIQSWEEVVGSHLAASTRPQKVSWPRRLSEDDPFEPATLVLRVEGPMALEIQHSSDVILQRVNRFFGWSAVGRLALRQGPLTRPKQAARRKGPDPAAVAEVKKSLSAVEDEGLRDALARLGAAIKRN